MLWRLVEILFRRHGEFIVVLDHDNLGAFNIDCDNILLRAVKDESHSHNPPKSLVIFPREVANEECRAQFLAAMSGHSSLVVLDSRVDESAYILERVVRKINRTTGRFPWIGPTITYRPDSDGYELEPDFVDGRPWVVFDQEQVDAAWLDLVGLGLTQGEKYVCFNVRDEEYSLSRDLGKQGQKRHDHSVQNYRNPPIENYVPAVEYLLSRDFTVLHMGASVEKRFPVTHPRFIHYAGSSFRSDFLDVFLYANCRFAFQGSGSGIDTLASMFNKPLCLTDGVPLVHQLSAPSSTSLRLLTPVLLAFEDSCRILRLSEMAGSSFSSSRDYSAHGLRLIYNDPSDIVECLQEMIAIVEDGDGSRPEFDELQRVFWEDLIQAWIGCKGSRPLKADAVGRHTFMSKAFIARHSKVLL